MMVVATIQQIRLLFPGHRYSRGLGELPGNRCAQLPKTHDCGRVAPPGLGQTQLSPMDGQTVYDDRGMAPEKEISGFVLMQTIPFLGRMDCFTSWMVKEVRFRLGR